MKLLEDTERAGIMGYKNALGRRWNTCWKGSLPASQRYANLSHSRSMSSL